MGDTFERVLITLAVAVLIIGAIALWFVQ